MSVPVDIAFPAIMQDSRAATEWQLEKVEQLPLLRPMCLVLKTMLQQRGLSDPSTGGLGGYSLINLIVYYLK